MESKLAGSLAYWMVELTVAPMDERMGLELAGRMAENLVYLLVDRMVD